MSGLGPAGCWLTHKRLESWSRMAKERVDAVRRATERNTSSENGEDFSATSSITSGCDSIGSCELNTDSVASSIEECNLTRDPTPIQPTASSSICSLNTELLRGQLDARANPIHSHLQHQSKSFPPRLQRTPSVSSQSSLDSAPSRQSGHRGSSPQIRTIGPDGRASMPTHETPYVSQYLTRSSSPLRAISLDARSHSPSSNDNEMRTPSPSQSSLASLASGNSFAGGSVGNINTIQQSPKIGRCLSPLLIPPRVTSALINESNLAPASPLGQLQLDLYTRNSGPMDITAPPDTLTVGKLHLNVKYDYHLFDLAVHLIEAHNLCPIENGGFRDPYVRLMLIPEVDQKKRQTLIHRGESSPYFDQSFKFPVSRDQLQGKELVLQVLDYDRYSHNDVLGELRIELDEVDLCGEAEIWGDLIRLKKPPEDKPELLVTLNFLPQAERFTVVIMKAKNLETDQCPYVKLYLIQNGKRVKKKKTSTGKSTDANNPIWNEQFIFNVSSASVNLTSLEIYVVGSGGEANAVGSCGIGPQEPGTGREHWYDMIHNARKTTAMWHYLR